MHMVIIALIWLGILSALMLIGLAYIKIEEYLDSKKEGKKNEQKSDK